MYVNPHSLAASSVVPLLERLRLLIQHYQAKHDHFLPVLAKGDLREHEARMPSLHLQRVDTTRLGHLSELEVNTIKPPSLNT